MYLIGTNIGNKGKALGVRVVTIRNIKIRDNSDVFLKTLSVDKAQLSVPKKYKSCLIFLAFVLFKYFPDYNEHS